MLNYEQVDKIVDRIKPSVVIPAHYHTQGSTSVISTLGNADDWVNAQGDATKLEGPTLALSSDDVKEMSGKVFYFGSHHLTK